MCLVVKIGQYGDQDHVVEIRADPDLNVRLCEQGGVEETEEESRHQDRLQFLAPDIKVICDRFEHHVYDDRLHQAVGDEQRRDRVDSHVQCLLDGNDHLRFQEDPVEPDPEADGGASDQCEDERVGGVQLGAVVVDGKQIPVIYQKQGRSDIDSEHVGHLAVVGKPDQQVRTHRNHKKYQQCNHDPLGRKRTHCSRRHALLRLNDIYITKKTGFCHIS